MARRRVAKKVQDNPLRRAPDRRRHWLCAGDADDAPAAPSAAAAGATKASFENQPVIPDTRYAWTRNLVLLTKNFRLEIPGSHR